MEPTTTSEPRLPDEGDERPRELLCVEDAADRLSIGRTAMFAYIKSGVIESVKVGRLRRIPTDAIAAYINQLTANQTNYREA